MALLQARQGYFSGTSTTLAFQSNVAANSLLIVSLHAYANVTDAVTVSDSQGNTYTRRILTNNASLGLQIWWAIAGSSGANTVSIGFPGATYCSIGIHEFSGMQTSLPVDVSNSATGSSNAPASGAITTLNANDVLFAGYTDSNGTNFAINGDGDYTLIQEYEDGVSYMHMQTQYRTVANTLTDTANWSIGASANWVGAVIAFKVSSAPGPVTVSLNAALLAAASQTLTAAPGAAAVDLVVSGISAVAQAAAALPGGVSTGLTAVVVAAAGQVVAEAPGEVAVVLAAVVLIAAGQVATALNDNMLYLTAEQVGLSIHLTWV